MKSSGCMVTTSPAGGGGNGEGPVTAAGRSGSMVGLDEIVCGGAGVGFDQFFLYPQLQGG